jgi:signal transduction histidine kinase
MLDVLKIFKAIPEFVNVPESQLQWLADHGKVVYFEDGEKVFNMGNPINDLRIVVKGEVGFYLQQGGNLRYIDILVPGEITGLLPYSRLKTSIAEGAARGETAIFNLSRDQFPEMISQHYELTAALVHVMTDRVRDFTKQQQQNEKMVALGKLSAGLAHELNNPSAAVIRSAQELKKHLSNLPDKFKGVIRIQTTEAVVDFVNDLVFSKIANASPRSLSMAERMEREDEITEWLESNQIPDADEMMESFAEFNLLPADLEALKSKVRQEDRAAVIHWINQVLITERLVNEIHEASKRINGLVCSIKSYTHMDQNPEKTPVDIHEGIRNTITMLNHKIKKNNIKLIERFQSDLPKAAIYISAMNQVWTNVIDNAVDAMEGRQDNVLEIKTLRDREFIWVIFIDNGPGIPDEIKDKIFDPFFTTKPIGKGTGLGLEVVRQIIGQHNGDVTVTSQPGRTEFKVCFPFGK